MGATSLAEQIDYCWRKEYGGLHHVPAKRLKEIEHENTWLRRLVADLSLEKAILTEGRLGIAEPPLTIAPHQVLRGAGVGIFEPTP